MRGATGLTSAGKFLRIAAVLVCWLLASRTFADAQSNQGLNAVYPASGICCAPSSAFIDASMFAVNVTNPNLCSVLNYILNPTNHVLPTGVTVIDARGLPGTTGTSMICTTANPSPWAGITNPPPSTILLPATGGANPNPIIIPSTWAIPTNTHLIGEGDGIPSSGSTPGTTIQAASGFSGTMIQFGSSSCPAVNSVPTCTGISVEKLALDGQGQSINGIANGFSQDFSSVDHVSLYQIRGTGLSVTGNANNSGPYSNITFDTGGYAGLSSTVCAQINGLSGTREIHGLSCISESNDAKAAILLDSSNNSIEDVRIVGFYDGISVGAYAKAQSNVLVNIIGDTTPGNAPCPIKVVHIYNIAGITVSDLSIMGLHSSVVSQKYAA